MSAEKFVYLFGGGKADGNEKMKNLLGGKGANLAEMCLLGIPVPAGFTVTTECCTAYFENNSKLPPSLAGQVMSALAKTEAIMGMKYGNPDNPLLVSCRSGARKSMPGMMDTVLNVGLSTATIPGMIKKTQNPRFVWDSYRRLIMMYADVVMEKAEGMEPAGGKGIRKIMDDTLDQFKHARGARSDTDLKADDLKLLAEDFKKLVLKHLGKAFPDDPMAQLWGGIAAVFKSWNGKKAVSYRRIEGIPDAWGTAVNVQAMVFGNMGDNSATGVAFTRDPATGDNKFYGEWLVNAQGEDVVAGIRTPSPINDSTKNEQNKHLHSMQEAMPGTYKALDAIRSKLERHFTDMLDIEFTIQEGKLWMLQCRVGKRTGTAALNMAMDMLAEKLIKEQTAVQRLDPKQLDELLHPIIDQKVEKDAAPIVKGLPAGPGAASGKLVFTAEEAVASAKAGTACILLREETNPEDVEGMRAAVGILTARGGMTSHAALVARGWGKCCIVGAGGLHVDAASRTARITGSDVVLKGGDVVTLNGTKGHVYLGALPMVSAAENPRFQKFMTMADKFRTMGVRTNAETPQDARVARAFGAEGIGLFRFEHMFYGEGSDRPLFLLRRMIVSKTEAERRKALEEMFPFMKDDVKKTMDVMDGLPVTFRFLDPPLHEFVPTREDERQRLASDLGISLDEFNKRADGLHESNPMMGHRGVRLGISYPEMTEVQSQAILEAAAELIQAGKNAKPEIMIPVTSSRTEVEDQKKLIERVYEKVLAKFSLSKSKLALIVGTMIEIPRACITADKFAGVCEFFSFGTNDLTQMGFGFSRDDIGSFLPHYLDKKILPADPFQTIDQEGIGELIRMGITKGRSVKPHLKIGICGEHGGEPESVKFCHRVGMSYVSCSPYRVPLARLAAAQAAIADLEQPKLKAPAKPAAKKAGARAPKKAAKSARKAAPKKTAKKSAAKKPAKKTVKKAVKKAPKKAGARAPKKTVKKAVKKTAKKTAARGRKK
jgi:pyruvate,orthophosphate dikinase